MTIQFKKFLSSLISVGLGYMVLRGLSYTVPANAGLAVIIFGIPYLVLSIGSVFLFYMLFKKLFIKSVEQPLQNHSPETTSNKKLIFVGISMALIQTPIIAGIFFVIRLLIDKEELWYNHSSVGIFIGATQYLAVLIALGMSILGFFFYPYFLKQTVSVSRRYLTVILYMLAPIIISALIFIFNIF